VEITINFGLKMWISFSSNTNFTELKYRKQTFKCQMSDVKVQLMTFCLKPDLPETELLLIAKPAK
jgi:hypothetical protein